MGTCPKSVRCNVKPVPELFHAHKRLTSRIVTKAANSKVLRYFQAQTSYPAQRPVPYTAESRPWRCRVVANVFAIPQVAKFGGLAVFLRCFIHFYKSSVRYMSCLPKLPYSTCHTGSISNNHAASVIISISFSSLHPWLERNQNQGRIV